MNIEKLTKKLKKEANKKKDAGKKEKKEEEKEPKFSFVTREEWGALPPRTEVPLLNTPVKRVRYLYTNVKEEDCCSLETCCREVRRIQESFLTQGLPDLPFSFLIGGDGRIYEGRGWYLDVDRHLSLKKFKRKCLDITYLGEFNRRVPPGHMEDAAADLVEYGIKKNLIQDWPTVETLNDYRDFLYEESLPV